MTAPATLMPVLDQSEPNRPCIPLRARSRTGALPSEATMQVKEALDTLTKAIRDDPGYRQVWHANIAVQFKDCMGDQIDTVIRKLVYDAADAAADRFIDLMLATIQPEEPASNDSLSSASTKVPHAH